ncbi:MAG: ABC transporter permease subunit [Deltaproteobacteria bacterium]|nr:ABC transporter permease subunit [Deltaproteobacteria bacterium]
MVKMLVIARATVREIIGQRLFLAVAGGALLLLLLGTLVAPLDIGERHKLFYDLGFAFLAFFLLLFTLLAGSRQLAGKRESGGFYWLLAKPVRRWQVLLGVFTGLAFLAGISLAGLGLVFALLLLAAGLPLGPAFLVALGFLYLKYLLLLGLVVLLGTTFSFFATVFFALGLFVIGHGTALLLAVSRHGGGPAAWAATAVYHLLPDFSAFHLASAALHHQLPASPVLLTLAAYGLGYLAVLLLLGCWRFSRVDLD